MIYLSQAHTSVRRASPHSTTQSLGYLTLPHRVLAWPSMLRTPELEARTSADEPLPRMNREGGFDGDAGLPL